MDPAQRQPSLPASFVASSRRMVCLNEEANVDIIIFLAGTEVYRDCAGLWVVKPTNMHKVIGNSADFHNVLTSRQIVEFVAAICASDLGGNDDVAPAAPGLHQLNGHSNDSRMQLWNARAVGIEKDVLANGAQFTLQALRHK